MILLTMHIYMKAKQCSLQIIIIPNIGRPRGIDLTGPRANNVHKLLTIRYLRTAIYTTCLHIISFIYKIAYAKLITIKV